MRVEQFKFSGSDESYTLPSLVEILIPYIERFKNDYDLEQITIWCPFDVKESGVYNEVELFRSAYVEVFEKYGYNVIASHIYTNQDFFIYEPKEHYDIIISNPPFKNKKYFFQRAIELNKPFALLNPASWFNDSGLNLLFDEDLQIINPNKRSKFYNSNGCIGKQPSFKSIYFCKNFVSGYPIQFVDMDTSKDEFFIQKNLEL